MIDVKDRLRLFLVCDCKSYKLYNNDGVEILPSEAGWFRKGICEGSPYVVDCTMNGKQVQFKACVRSIDPLMESDDEGNKED